MKEKKGFLKELEDRNVWQEIKDYIFSNMANATAQEWGMINTP